MSEMNSSNLIKGDWALYFSPVLACWVGLKEAIFLGELHKCLKEVPCRVSDNRTWYRQATFEWQPYHFPFWDGGVIRRLINHLKEDGLIQVRDDLIQDKWTGANWFTINYDEVESLKGPTPRVETKRKKRVYANRATFNPKHNQSGFVYIGQKYEATCHYKIGLSKDADRRTKELGLDQVHIIPADNMAAAETRLHERFADYRLDGEWFVLYAKQIEEIKSITEYKQGEFICYEY